MEEGRVHDAHTALEALGTKLWLARENLSKQFLKLPNYQLTQLLNSYAHR
jgi:transposase